MYTLSNLQHLNGSDFVLSFASIQVWVHSEQVSPYSMTGLDPFNDEEDQFDFVLKFTENQNFLDDVAVWWK